MFVFIIAPFIHCVSNSLTKPRLSNPIIGVCKVSDTPGKIVVGMCFCLQTCISALNMVVMVVVIGQSLIVLPLYNVLRSVGAHARNNFTRELNYAHSYGYKGAISFHFTLRKVMGTVSIMHWVRFQARCCHWILHRSRNKTWIIEHGLLLHALLFIK